LSNDVCLTHPGEWWGGRDANFLKLQRLHNRVLRANGKLGRKTPIHDIKGALKIPYEHYYITGQEETIQMKHTRLKIGGSQAYGHSSD
jgi:hypothetical protein